MKEARVIRPGLFEIGGSALGFFGGRGGGGRRFAPARIVLIPVVMLAHVGPVARVLVVVVSQLRVSRDVGLIVSAFGMGPKLGVDRLVLIAPGVVGGPLRRGRGSGYDLALGQDGIQVAPTREIPIASFVNRFIIFTSSK